VTDKNQVFAFDRFWLFQFKVILQDSNSPWIYYWGWRSFA